MKKIPYLLLLALLALTSSCDKRNTEISIKGDKFCINGVETFKGKSWRGHSIEGLLPNARVVNGIFEDENPETSVQWAYPDTGEWDAERNTDEFIAAMEQWRASGLLAFTINLQGGSPQGYGNAVWINSALTPRGELKEPYMNRLERILDRADELGMVAIVGIFYFGQSKQMTSEEDYHAAIRNSVNWILDKGYTNVMVEITNECDIKAYGELGLDVLRNRAAATIALAQSITKDGRRLLVSTSYQGGRVPSAKVIEQADFILLHGNGQKKPGALQRMIDKTRQSPSYTSKPVMINEDDNFRFEADDCNFMVATELGVSWGFFDYRKKGEGFDEGFQSVPVCWGISSERKRAFFGMISEW
ncbi:MAG: hypothetical protein SNH88_04465 [Rikenellaceae bacterium]